MDAHGRPRRDGRVDGYLNIVGRIKDMVIRGGENLYPREIEELLFQHPAVASVQVIGVPDERMGEELMAWVVLREGAEASEDDLRDLLPRARRPLQGASVLQVRDRVPDDRDRARSRSSRCARWRSRSSACESAAAITTA